MLATIELKSKKIKIDLSKPLDISIPIRDGHKNVNAWYIGPPSIKPERFDDDIVSVAEGASVNFNTINFNPHSHGTHTETVGHIVEKKHSINKALNTFFFHAEVITVAPENLMKDAVISAKQLRFAIGNKVREAIVIRTIPNLKDKKTMQYSNTNWPYLKQDAIEYFNCFSACPSHHQSNSKLEECNHTLVLERCLSRDHLLKEKNNRKIRSFPCHFISPFLCFVRQKK